MGVLANSMGMRSVISRIGRLLGRKGIMVTSLRTTLRSIAAIVASTRGTAASTGGTTRRTLGTVGSVRTFVGRFNGTRACSGRGLCGIGGVMRSGNDKFVYVGSARNGPPPALPAGQGR